MIKRIIEISQAGKHLSVKYGQLVIRSFDTVQDGKEGIEAVSIPCEDIGVLLVEHSGVSYTHSVFTELLKCGAAVVLCGGDHHPAGMLLPLESNSVQTERFRQQIEVKEPVKKKLWQQIIRAKIKHQAKIVGAESEIYKTLMALREQVRSGDPDNIEAQTSKKYWMYFMQDVRFHRDINGAAPNNMLNYGYMVMRAAVARALCSAGLLPGLGIHHCNRYNAYCLADDMIEPFRGFVESKVKEICEGEGGVPDELNQGVKAKLLEVLDEPVEIPGLSGPLRVGQHPTKASQQRCYRGEQQDSE
ncbi:MAG: type II CRISPR-associated endonuclease Cas1 [Planctomycetota bacterium]|nr:type II CRISPR-associated endonuclease Cas1 [Planctomycetota bacterium]